MPDRWNEKSVFLAAAELGAAERAEFLARVCPDEAAIGRIVALLAHHDRSSVLAGAAGAGWDTDVPGRIAEFEVIRELGRGGMGVVLLAWDSILQRQVAIKLLAPHVAAARGGADRLRQEARAAAALRHPNIVSVYRYEESGGRQYIVMEFVDGHTLADRMHSWRESAATGVSLTRGTRAGLADHARCVARLVESVADALDHAHRLGVIHRDVKPSNILIDRSDLARLTDFGIAKVLADESMTQTGAQPGTARYMSPEQAGGGGGELDSRTDVFSLGVVLFEALTLVHPFEGPSQQAVLEAIRDPGLEAPRLRDLCRGLPRDLEVICQKAMEKQVGLRYPTAAHLAADLRCYLNGEPILARPPGVVRRIRAWARRRNGWLSVGGLAACIAGAGGVGLLEAHRERARRCGVTLNTEPPGLVVRVCRSDGAEAEEPIEATTPAFMWLLPGHYRVRAISGAGSGMGAERFGESSILLPRAGVRASVTLRTRELRERDPEEMIAIPGGWYDCGVAGGRGARAPRRVFLEAFLIDRAEVSNAEYLAFVEATGHSRPVPWQEFGDPGVALADHPVVGVTWEDAQAFARWVGKRLPSAEEWEVAARWPDGRLLPWAAGAAGEKWYPAEFRMGTLSERDAMDNSGLAEQWRLYALGSRPVRSGAELCTALGMFHASTNVREWTDTVYFGTSPQVVVKGGTWVNDPVWTDLASAATLPVETGAGENAKPAWSMRTGFRCARSAPDR